MKIEIDNNNYITIEEQNNVFSYGLNYCTGNAGGGFNHNFEFINFSDKQKCIEEALNKIKERHLYQKEQSIKFKDSCGNYNKQKSEFCVNKINLLLSDLKPKNIQLTLF